MKRCLLLSVCILFASLSLLAQHENKVQPNPAPVNKKLISHLTKQPEFPGGEAELIAFLKKNIVYPQMERDNDIQGKVVVRFMVMETGEVKNLEVIRPVSAGLDREAVRVIKLMPKWSPGMYNTKPVIVYYVLPVVFKLT